MGLIRALLFSAAAFLSLLCYGQVRCYAAGGPIGESGKAQSAEARPARAGEFGITIVKTYPHDPQAFTQGLVFSDGFLYESTGAHHGNSSLRKLDLETGRVLKQYTLAEGYFGEGLTLWQKRLIQLTWRSGMGFVYDRDSFLEVGDFRYDTEGWGITHDGKSLIMSDGTALLRFLDPESFEEKRRIEVLDQGVPVRNLNELEFIKGEIFANIWGMDTIARVSPETGTVLGWIDLSMLRRALGPVQEAEALNGIAYDRAGDRIFVTGKLWPKLFEVKLVPR